MFKKLTIKQYWLYLWDVEDYFQLFMILAYLSSYEYIVTDSLNIHNISLQFYVLNLISFPIKHKKSPHLPSSN